MEISHKSTRAAIDKVRESMVSMRHLVNSGIYARTVRLMFCDKESNIHVFFDPDLAERKRQDLYHTVEIREETLSQLEQLTKKDAKRYQNHFNVTVAEDGTFRYERNYEKIDKISNNCGYFCLLTNTKAKSSEVLTIYRRKDVIERGFDDLKNHIDMKRLRTHSTHTIDGKMFCAFIALIVALEIVNRLSVFMKDKSMSKDAVISELEKIKAVFTNDGRRLINPITKTQRTILELCGFSEDNLKSYIGC
jgi:transposase